MRGKLPSPDEPPEEQIRLLRQKALTPVSPIDIFESDERAIFEIGSPAYRIARSRSGLGWIETQAELARFQGLMLRSLLTGHYYTTRSPLALLAVFLCAMLMGVLPLALIVAAAWVDGVAVILWVLPSAILNILFGLAMLGSLVASIDSLLGKWK